MRRVYYYDEKLGKVVERGSSKTESSNPFTVVNMLHTSPKDGSRLENPMSQSYVNDIYGRTLANVGKRKLPGSYGA